MQKQIAGSFVSASSLNLSRVRTHLRYAVAGLGAMLFCGAPLMAQSTTTPFGFLPDPVRVVSTVPANGDVNPYGVAFVPYHWSAPAGSVLQPGDVLVSNFNSSANLQGTGTTIVRIPAAGGPATVFYQNAATAGLSTALEITRNGFVIVGSFPSIDGTAATAGAGSLVLLDANGKVLLNYVNPKVVNGPWDSTLYESGNSFKLFVSNAITGEISRIDFMASAAGASLQSAEVIASGYMHTPDAAAFFDAPTGLVYDSAADVLYVASTLDNEVFAVSDAGSRTSDGGRGQVAYSDTTHLHGALAMTAAPNGDLLVSNNDIINGDMNQPSEIVEFTKGGTFVKQLSVDANVGGSFGLKVQTHDGISRFAAVDDNAASLLIWTMPKQ